MHSLSSLPPELVREVLLYLPVPSLLAFSQTNKHNHSVAQVSLTTLNIGLFPNRLHALLSDMDSTSSAGEGEGVEANKRINIILSKRKSRTASMTMFHQNAAAARILHRHAPALKSLELALWDLQAPAADALAKASRLRHLALRLDHPHARAADLHRSFWCSSPGSTVWNSLYASPARARSCSPSPSPSPSQLNSISGPQQQQQQEKEKEQSSHLPSPPQSPTLAPQRQQRQRPETPSPQPPVFGRLESLTLERAGITDWQLLRIISENPRLTELRLRKCLTLTDDFFRELSRTDVGRSRLRLLHFTHSDNPLVDRRVLRWIGKMGALESLSFAGCLNLNNAQIEELNEDEWHIPDLTLPCPGADATTIEVDPAYN